MKKHLARVLTLALVLGMLAVSAGAAEPAAPPFAKISRTETHMVTLYGQEAEEITIYYLPEGGGELVGGIQPVTQLSLKGTHTDAATGKTVYDLSGSGYMGADANINWLNGPETVIEVGSSDDIDGTGVVGNVFYVVFEGCTVFAEQAATAAPTVDPSACKATLDGKEITLNAYLFTEASGGTNYVMLRDVAYLLNGSAAQFEVTWDKDKGIILTTKKAYTTVGGELESKGDSPKEYAENACAITVNDQSVELTAYTIEGNNYFKLRDLGTALGFGVDWDGATGTVTVTTK